MSPSKRTYKDLCIAMDFLHMMPLLPNETIEIRAEAIEALIINFGWSRDDIIAEILKPQGN